MLQRWEVPGLRTTIMNIPHAYLIDLVEAGRLPSYSFHANDTPPHATPRHLIPKLHHRQTRQVSNYTSAPSQRNIAAKQSVSPSHLTNRIEFSP
jgi:hypothetical protein